MQSCHVQIGLAGLELLRTSVEELHGSCGRSRRKLAFFPQLCHMADSDLQAALHQSKVFDLNQVGQVMFSFLPLFSIFSETNGFNAISGRLQTRHPGTCFMLLSCCPEFYACLLIIIRCRLSQAHANVFPHHIFGPEPIDDQINFDPSRPIQNGMFSLKGKRALFLCCCLQRAYFPVFRAARWLRKSSAR